MTETSPTLLVKVRDATDHTAWSRFDALYRPLITSWVRASGVPRSDVDDLVQDVLAAVQRALCQNFEYDPARGKFRQYLSRAVRSKVADCWQRRKRQPVHIEYVGEGPACDDPNDEVEERHYREYLLRQIMEQVRGEVEEENWQIFIAYRVEKQSAKSVAQRYGITDQAVANRAFRVIEKARELARSIDRDLWPGD